MANDLTSSTSSPSPPPGGGGGSPPELYQNIISEHLFQARLKAHDFVQEHLKQIITIASAVITVTVTFLKDIVGTKGDQLKFAGLLPLSWLLLGLAVCAAVYGIAIHVNSLDWPNKNKLSASFAAGANNHSRVAVFITIIFFGLGMLSLGGVAAANFDLMIQRGGADYKVASAYEAVVAAREQIDSNILIRRLEKVELTKGVDESLAGAPTWNVQFEIERSTAESDSSSNSVQSDPRCARKCVRPCSCHPASAAPESESYSCLIDARSGSLLVVP